MKTCMINFLQRFRKNEDGATAVEFAMVSPLLAGLFLASLDLGSTGFTQNRLNSSLRFSAQYVANGGTDTGVAQQVFARSFGEYRSFSSAIVCDCAKSREDITTAAADEQAPPEAPGDVIGTFTGDTGQAPQCTASCGDAAALRYLKFDASVMSVPIWGTEMVEISDSVSVRLK